MKKKFIHKSSIFEGGEEGIVYTEAMSEAVIMPNISRAGTITANNIISAARLGEELFELSENNHLEIHFAPLPHISISKYITNLTKGMYLENNVVVAFANSLKRLVGIDSRLQFDDSAFLSEVSLNVVVSKERLHNFVNEDLPTFLLNLGIDLNWVKQIIANILENVNENCEYYNLADILSYLDESLLNTYFSKSGQSYLKAKVIPPTRSIQWVVHANGSLANMKTIHGTIQVEQTEDLFLTSIENDAGLKTHIVKMMDSFKYLLGTFSQNKPITINTGGLKGFLKNFYVGVSKSQDLFKGLLTTDFFNDEIISGGNITYIPDKTIDLLVEGLLRIVSEFPSYEWSNFNPDKLKGSEKELVRRIMLKVIKYIITKYMTIEAQSAHIDGSFERDVNATMHYAALIEMASNSSLNEDIVLMRQNFASGSRQDDPFLDSVSILRSNVPGLESNVLVYRPPTEDIWPDRDVSPFILFID